MSDFDRNIATARAGYRPEVAIDAGLARLHDPRLHGHDGRPGADRAGRVAHILAGRSPDGARAFSLRRSAKQSSKAR